MKNKKQIKTIFMGILVSCLSLIFYPQQTIAANSTTPISSGTITASKTEIIVSRINEIKTMDKSNLKPQDKKILRNELLSMKSQLECTDNGIYISVGGIIIILLLLILIF